ncbi:Uncharacterized protein Rs2_46001 [Raphanus sativus]|nr:Uncharacterized protein Rs2_46001 [Raphanus sativus]
MACGSPKILPGTVLEAQTRSSSPRRRHRLISPALDPLTILPFSITLVVPFHCSMYCFSVRVSWMVGRRQTRQMLRRRRGLFVALLLVALSCQLVLPPVMSREDSLAVAIRRSLGSNSDVFSSVRRQTSHDVHYVQAVQSFSEHRCQLTSSSLSSPARLESHKPPRVAPILQTGVRSRSFTGTDPEVLPGSVLLRSSSSFEEKLLPPLASSVLLPSVCFRFLIGLLSCVAVSTGPEDTIGITLVFLVDEVWISTSHYVTILQLSDFIVKATSTHSSTVSNSLSSSVEDLSCLVYICVVCYVYGYRGWIIPSIYCSVEV